MSETEFSWKNAQGFQIVGNDWRPTGAIRGSIALVHGLGEHIWRYQHVAAAINTAGYSLVGIDLPGHGRSGGPRGHSSYDLILDEIDHLLGETKKRYPGAPTFLYGHSLGGALVLYYALKQRPALRGVIATSPGLLPGDPVPEAKVLLAKIMSRIAPAFTLENGLDLNNLSEDAAVITTYKSDPLVHSRVSALLGRDLLAKGAWIQANAGHFPLPLLLMVGSADHLISPQAVADFAQAVPVDKITYKVWEGLYHETHNSPQKQQVLQYLIDWLNQHTQSV